MSVTLSGIQHAATIRKAALLAGGKPVEVREVAGGTLLRFPTPDRDPVDTIVVLERAQ